MHLAPGSPTDLQTTMNPKMSQNARQQLKRLYGLDKPVHIQYFNWVKRLVTADFGTSFVDGRPVISKVMERLPITVLINVLSLLIIIAVAFPVGIMSALNRNTLMDKIVTIFVFLGFAAPSFWVALLLMILFGVTLGWLPISGLQSLDVSNLTGIGIFFDRLRHLILPVFISAFSGLAGFSRYTRSEMLEVIGQDYIRTARAKGLGEPVVILKHAVRNAMIPIVTILGLAVPGLIGGSVIFETIFAIPGMGQLFYQSVLSRDYPVIMCITVIGAVLTLLGNFLADIAYTIVDPRVKF